MPATPSRGPSQQRALRVLLIDNHEVSRCACRALLRTEGIDVVGDVPLSGATAAGARSIRPDAVIIDLSPADEALALARRLLATVDPPVVVLTSSADPGTFAIALEGLAFVPKAAICAGQIRWATDRPRRPDRPGDR